MSCTPNPLSRSGSSAGLESWRALISGRVQGGSQKLPLNPQGCPSGMYGDCGGPMERSWKEMLRDFFREAY